MKRPALLRPQVWLLIVVVIALVSLGSNAQAVQDWLRLHNYQAPAQVAQLAADDTMTSRAEHLFYVNQPVITAGQDFKSHCPLGNEKTVVLGCYVGPDRGIYLFSVTDDRLQGIEQVTAAHEMLHAAYRRLSSSERSTIDTQLNDFYLHGLTDQRIKDTIDAYRKSEPNDLVNEMHSIFGTEVPNLPPALEQYYKQYFTNRSKVTAYTANYQGEFTHLHTQVADYDSCLATLKQQIDTNEAQLSQQRADLDTQDAQLKADRQGNVNKYNSEVSTYNQAVNAYNTLLTAIKNLIGQYNDIVNARNAIAIEEQQLSQELSPSALQTK